MRPTIDDTQFGSITIDGQVCDHDIVIRLNGNVKKRKKKLSKKKSGTSHLVSLEEAKHIFDIGAKRLIVGAGQYGALKLSNEAEAALKQILDSSTKSTRMMREIARATVEQARGSKEVTTFIQRIAETVQQIALATAQQAKGSEQIMNSAERMRVITQHVHGSSQEQARGSKQITGAIENISEMVHHLNRAQKEQTRGAEQVMQAVERIKEVAEHHSDSMSNMKKIVDLVAEQAETLRSEMSRFKL